MLWRSARPSLWNPWHDLRNFNDEISRLFGDLGEFTTRGEYPPVNVWFNDYEARFTVKLPGVSLEDLEITANQDTLTLKGNRAAEVLPEGASYLRQERGSGSFVRTFALPFPVDSENVEAGYKDGILVVRLPKAKSVQPRKINVTTA